MQPRSWVFVMALPRGDAPRALEPWGCPVGRRANGHAGCHDVSCGSGQRLCRCQCWLALRCDGGAAASFRTWGTLLSVLLDRLTFCFVGYPLDSPGEQARFVFWFASEDEALEAAERVSLSYGQLRKPQLTLDCDGCIAWVESLRVGERPGLFRLIDAVSIEDSCCLASLAAAYTGVPVRGPVAPDGMCD